MMSYLNQSRGLEIVESFVGEYVLTDVVSPKKEKVKSIQSFQSVFTSEWGSKGRDMTMMGVHLDKTRQKTV